ncbi:hypothetical protein BDZ94DRAFT_1133559, partial [Collybia nuda]
NNTLIQFASAFSQFSPNTQSQAISLIKSSTVPTIPTASSLLQFLFSTNDELPASSSSHDPGYFVHPFIVRLAENKLHIPLTLFTSKSTNRLFKETTTIKQTTTFNPTGVKCHIIDLSHFPDEDSLDIADWHESWNRYKNFQRIYCVPKIATRWENHYAFLSKHDDFRTHFPAILKFDIQQRTNYSV